MARKEATHVWSIYLRGGRLADREWRGNEEDKLKRASYPDRDYVDVISSVLHEGKDKDKRRGISIVIDPLLLLGIGKD